MVRIALNDDGILVIRFQDGVRSASTKEPFPEVFVDLDATGNVISIEVVGAEEFSSANLARVLKQFGLDEHLYPAAS
jgi:uncharacterized protein YuzE